jgi:hypothetical protein
MAKRTIASRVKGSIKNMVDHIKPAATGIRKVSHAGARTLGKRK